LSSRLCSALRLVQLLLTTSAINAQKRRSTASKGNPLGRVMMAYEEVKDRPFETIELKVDEAILRETPKLEFGLNFLKLAAGVAPLLGLLGTVTGMIRTFTQITLFGTGDPQIMAGRYLRGPGDHGVRSDRSHPASVHPLLCSKLCAWRSASP
jgi:biopolymer transport protein ExbB